MPSASRPYFSRRATAGPDSPNTSFTPIRFTGTGAFSERHSHTAPPKPPIIECSSTVTTLPVSFAASTRRSESIGLIVWMLITSASIPSAADSSLEIHQSTDKKIVSPILAVSLSFLFYLLSLQANRQNPRAFALSAPFDTLRILPAMPLLWPHFVRRLIFLWKQTPEIL